MFDPMPQTAGAKFSATRGSRYRVAPRWAADRTMGRMKHGSEGSLGIVGGRGGTQTWGANVERGRQRNVLTITLARRSVRMCTSAATPRYAFVAIADKGRKEKRWQGARGRRGECRQELRGAAAKSYPKAAQRRSSPGLRLDFTEAALVDPPLRVRPNVRSFPMLPRGRATGLGAT